MNLSIQTRDYAEAGFTGNSADEQVADQSTAYVDKIEQ